MAAPLPEQVRPLRRREYDQLVLLGAFEDEKIELLQGALVPMSPIGPPHSSAVQKLNKLLVIALADRAEVRPGLPFAASDLSEPEPDLAVVPLGEYSSDHPERACTIIEVADSSLERDRGLKLWIYAQCGVPEYWIVNVRERVIEVHREPRDGRYHDVRQVAEGERAALLAFPDVAVAVAELFGPRG